VQYPRAATSPAPPSCTSAPTTAASDYAKSFIAFGNVASQLKNDTVLGAWLGIFNTWS